jgi:hypothetical protein
MEVKRMYGSNENGNYPPNYPQDYSPNQAPNNYPSNDYPQNYQQGYPQGYQQGYPQNNPVDNPDNYLSNNQSNYQPAPENKKKGSHLLGTLGALLGVIVGAAALIVPIVFLGYIYFILVALLGVAVPFGYHLLGGKKSGMARFAIIVIIGVVGIVCALVAAEYFVVMEDYAGTFFEFPVDYFTAFLNEADFRSGVISDFGFPFVLAVAGLGFGIFYLARGDFDKNKDEDQGQGVY